MDDDTKQLARQVKAAAEDGAQGQTTTQFFEYIANLRDDAAKLARKVLECDDS